MSFTLIPGQWVARNGRLFTIRGLEAEIDGFTFFDPESGFRWTRQGAFRTGLEIHALDLVAPHRGKVRGVLDAALALHAIQQRWNKAYPLEQIPVEALGPMLDLLLAKLEPEDYPAMREEILARQGSST